MPLSRDLGLFLNHYLDSTTRLSLAQVNNSFQQAHQMWCVNRARYLLELCPVLRYLTVTKLSAMLASPRLRITYESEMKADSEGINDFFKFYTGAIDNNDENRADMLAMVFKLMMRHGLRRVPKCRPLFITTYNGQLIVLDEELNLYMDDKCVLTDVVDVNFHSGCSDMSVRTHSGQAYFLESKSVQVMEPGRVINHISGAVYYICDRYYLGDGCGLHLQISKDPVVLFCSNDCTFLITVEKKGVRASCIMGLDDEEVMFTSQLPPVRVAVDICYNSLEENIDEDRSAEEYDMYLVLFDDGCCALIEQKTDDSTQLLIHPQKETYDHIVRHENGLLARRGEEWYYLFIKGNEMSSMRCDQLRSTYVTEGERYSIVY